MKASRFKAVHQGLTSVAQKIYEAVPLQEAWSSDQIIREYSRLHGTTQQKRVVEGVLDNLIQSGLVAETGRGLFIRIQIKEKTPAPELQIIDKEEPKIMALKPQVKKETNPLDLLLELSDKAAKIVINAQLLKQDIEKAALEIAEKFQESEEKSKKLTQLQALLKGLAE